MNARLFFCLALCGGVSAWAAEWRRAEPGWRYEFPRDHRAHPEFKTEWWYFTGNLEDEKGRRFGYQLTFFRHGIRPPAQREAGRSRFIVDDLKFAHFTITDVAGRRFRFWQKTSRGAFGEAGFDEGARLAWIDEWSLRLAPEGTFDLEAESETMALRLRLAAQKLPVNHGRDGISRKAAGDGYASHYYSLTRLATEGEIELGGDTIAVRGLSWFDHEWATSQLAPGQVGWDWLSLHLDDGSELMLYRMRLEDGGQDPASSGTFVGADGAARHLTNEDFTMQPTDFWKSAATGARYPTAWRLTIPRLGLELKTRALLENQELALKPFAYWEGAVEASGTRDGKPIAGRGYLELTGYAGPLRELQR